MNSLDRIFGVSKPVIAMLHLPGLPGRPLHDVAGGPDAIYAPVSRDLDVLQEAGVDGVLFCNEKDYPYQLKVGPEVAAAMAATIGRLRDRIKVPFGVNLLWDPTVSLAVARATGASFIREVLTGRVRVRPRDNPAEHRRDLGLSDGHRRRDVALFDNISPEFSSPLGTRTIADRARGAAFLGMDAILISGWAAGSPMAMADLVAAKEAAPETPIIANTGVRADRVAEIMKVADGAIVGTSLKVDGITWNAVDPKRVREADGRRAQGSRHTAGA